MRNLDGRTHAKYKLGVTGLKLNREREKIRNLHGAFFELEFVGVMYCKM